MFRDPRLTSGAGFRSECLLCCATNDVWDVLLCCWPKMGSMAVEPVVVVVCLLLSTRLYALSFPS